MADVRVQARRASRGAHAWDVVADDGAGGTRTWPAFGALDAQGRAWVWIDGEAMIIETPASQGRRVAHGADSLSAPMPATVVNVLVSPGDIVIEGQVLVMLEAMKMEVPLRAPHGGTVSEVRCAPGTLVQPGTPLVLIEEARDVHA